MVSADERNAFRYVAFISYSHADRKQAVWLHRAIEGYQPPSHVSAHPKGAPNGGPGSEARSELPQRLKPVFLDQEELSSSHDLAESVRAALGQSHFLIILCSPASARSRWVNEEIRSFRALGRSHRILCVLVSGEPAAVTRGFPPELECFPPALFERAPQDTGPIPEPLAADLRHGKRARHDVQLRIVAALLGVPFDVLRRRDQIRRQRRLGLITAASVAMSVVLAGLAISAWLARNEAVRQRTIAQQKSLTAERTAQFMVSLFQVSDPSEARGNSITAREILDRGARQIDDSLRDEPAVRAELTTTLGQVYTGLGLYGPATDLLSKAAKIPEQSADASLRASLAQAELELQQSNFQQSEDLLAKAEVLRARSDPDNTALRIRILLGRGDAAALLENTDQSRAFFEQAIALLGADAGKTDDGVRAYEGLALATYYGGDLPEAERLYERALMARRTLSGDTHPRVSDSLNQLGTIAYEEGDSRKAEEYFQKVLDVDRKVLGPKHPNVAMTMMNLGRLRLERREYTLARATLGQAVELIRAQNPDTNQDLVFGFSNLALADMGLGLYREAAPLLDKAMKAAIANDHPLQGPIQVYLGVVACHSGHYKDGLAALELARPVVIARYPDDPWRVAQLDTVRADCLLGLKRDAEAGRLIDANLPVLLKRWPANTAIGADGLQRALRAYAATGDDEKLARYRSLMPQP